MLERANSIASRLITVASILDKFHNSFFTGYNYFQSVRSHHMRKRTVYVRDKMQKGYRYALSAPKGRDFDPEFKPQLTPAQMLQLGVFAAST